MQGAIDMGDDLDIALAAYAEAREIFMARFFESGGTDCTKNKALEGTDTYTLSSESSFL